MKISQWLAKPWLFGRDRKIELWYVATLPGGIEGMGKTVADAIWDARHEYRTWHDGPVEQGRCMKGKMHK